jgi:DNA-binding transcriptional LysR family regulator
LTLPYQVAALGSVPGTMLVATHPEQTVLAESLDERLSLLPAPEEISRSMDYTMSWHPRLDEDLAHQWLRDVVRSVTVSGARVNTITEL